jgi:hypothetical protein
MTEWIILRHVEELLGLDDETLLLEMRLVPPRGIVWMVMSFVKKAL